MRRKERQVADPGKIDAIIASCDCCRLGFADGKAAYIVPVNFAFAKENEQRVFYIHGASVGRKADLVRENGVCGFEMDTAHAVTVGDVACDYSFLYQSVIGKGSIAFVEDLQEKKRALDLIMAHYAEKENWEYPAAMVERIGILRLEVTELSCKEHA